MMTAADIAKARAEMAKLLVGATIRSIDRPDPGKQECLFKVTAERGRHEVEFHLHATELGWWVSGVKEKLHSAPRATYARVDDAFSEILDHILLSEAFHERDPEVEAIEDVLTRTVGFRCKVTDREWWLSLAAVKASPWAHDFATPESRAAMAAHLTENLSVPRPTPPPAAETA